MLGASSTGGLKLLSLVDAQSKWAVDLDLVRWEITSYLGRYQLGVKLLQRHYSGVEIRQANQTE